MDELENYTFDSFSHSLDEVIKKNPELSSYLKYESPFERTTKRIEAAKKELEPIIQAKKDIVKSFNNCIVSAEITGEWNVIQKEINDYLFHKNHNGMGIYGDCPHMKVFFNQEKVHLNSIKSKLGANAIELQMICSIVAEAVILEIEACTIQAKCMKDPNETDYSEEMRYRNYMQSFLRDSLNVMKDVSSLNMEYQYKYERFTPFYKSLIEKGKQVGLNIEGSSKSKSGCLSIIILAIVSTLLCSFF